MNYWWNNLNLVKVKKKGILPPGLSNLTLVQPGQQMFCKRLSSIINEHRTIRLLFNQLKPFFNVSKCIYMFGSAQRRKPVIVCIFSPFSSCSCFRDKTDLRVNKIFVQSNVPSTITLFSSLVYCKICRVDIGRRQTTAVGKGGGLLWSATATRHVTSEPLHQSPL